MSVKQADFYAEVIASIGGTLVDVELADTDLAICFKKAKRTMLQRGHQNYRHSFIELDVTTDVFEYSVPTTVTDVVKILPPYGGGYTSSNDLFTISAYNSMFNSVNGSNYSCGGVDFVLYELALAQLDTIERFSATAVDYRFDQFANKVKFLAKPKRAGKYYVECYLDLLDEEYYEMDWIVRWTIAEAKIMLGTAYRKFSALASPQGDGSIGGMELITDGQSEKDTLNQEILDYVDGSVDYMGVYIC